MPGALRGRTSAQRERNRRKGANARMIYRAYHRRERLRGPTRRPPRWRTDAGRTRSPFRGQGIPTESRSWCVGRPFPTSPTNYSRSGSRSPGGSQQAAKEIGGLAGSTLSAAERSGAMLARPHSSPRVRGSRSSRFSGARRRRAADLRVGRRAEPRRGARRASRRPAAVRVSTAVFVKPSRSYTRRPSAGCMTPPVYARVRARDAAQVGERRVFHRAAREMKARRDGFDTSGF